MPKLDYLINNTAVFDGDRVEPQQVSVGIRADRIAYVGPSVSGWAAHETIDAAGKYLCPGFIDTHASTGLGYLSPDSGLHKLAQGVTTEIIGNCGTSTAPVGDLLVPTMEQLTQSMGTPFSWRSLGEWFSQITAFGLPFNIGSYVGHGTLRAGVCRDPVSVTSDDLDRMAFLLDCAMREGALGMSTGLVYAPGSFANTQELIDLAIVAKNRGGLYASHIRDERQDLEDAIEEAIEIGRQAGIPVLVSHLKAAEKPNWGKIPRVIRHIENARAEGISVSFEVYPYTAVSTKLRSYLPKDILQDGLAGMVERLKTESWSNRSINWLEKRGTDFDNMVVISDRIPAARGRSIGRVARGNGRHPAQVAIDILILDPDAWMVYDCISEEDMDLAVLWPESIICSDSWSYPVNAPVQIGNPHPRTYGAFTRFLERYVLGRQEISFGQAVKKVSTYAADWLGFTDRGRIREGFAADIVILDPENVHEKATYEEPRQYSEGTEYVWVNGKMVINCSLQTDELPGTVLTRQDRSIPC